MEQPNIFKVLIMKLWPLFYRALFVTVFTSFFFLRDQSKRVIAQIKGF